MKRFFVIFFTLILTLLCSCYDSNRTFFDKLIDSLDSEQKDITPYVQYDMLIFGEEKLDFNDLLKNNGIEGSFNQVYVVQDDLVWFGYSQGTEEYGIVQWTIATVLLNGQDLHIEYTGIFGEEEGAEYAYEQHNNSHQMDKYLRSTGFYYDEKIVLTDHVKLIEYNLKNDIVNEYAASEYLYPTHRYQVEILDKETIRFNKDSEEKIFTSEDGMLSSAMFNKMYQLKEIQTWDERSLLSELFDKVQLIDDRIYIICRVDNPHGEVYALIYEYDFEKNTCQYVLNCFMWDVIRQDLYVVPVL